MKTNIERIIQQDILNELLKHRDKYNITDTEFTDFCNKRINVYMKQIVLKDVTKTKHFSSRTLHKNKKNMCVARLWLDGYSGQCSHKIVEEDLCKKHNSMLTKYGKLRFGRVCDPKPNVDLIKGNKLPWL